MVVVSSKPADLVDADNPELGYKRHKAFLHSMRHINATYALDSGAELATVRDNLRHALISTTLIYLHADDLKRARRLGATFSPRG